MKLNYGKFVGKKINPVLQQIATEVFCQMPSVSFEATRTGFYAFNPTDNEEEVIVSFDVLVGFDRVGKLTVRKGEWRNTGNKDIIYIESRLINKQRGKTNETKTINAKRAVSQCLQVFRPKEKSELVKQLIDNTSGEIGSMVWSAGRTLKNPDDLAPAWFYFLDIHRGGNPTPPESVMKYCAENEEKIDSYNVALAVKKAFQDKFGVIVQLERDETISVVDCATQEFMNIKSTYDLPENYQEKLAILKIMEDNQPVRHMGCKFAITHESVDKTLFFLVGGATIPE